MRHAEYRNGFSLIESLVVMGMTIALSIFIFASFSPRSNRATLESLAKQVVATLREAQSRAAAQDGATAWGVRFDNTTATTPFYALFKTSYSSQNTVGYYRLPTGVSYSTSSIAQGSSVTVTFSQVSGTPSATSSLVFNLTAGAASGAVTTSTTIVVNATGLISF